MQHDDPFLPGVTSSQNTGTDNAVGGNSAGGQRSRKEPSAPASSQDQKSSLQGGCRATGTAYGQRSFWFGTWERLGHML